MNIMYEQAAQAAADGETEAELAALMEQAAQAIERMGISVQDFLDELPAAQTEVLHEIYGPAYMREIEARIAAYQQQTPSRPTTGEG